MDILESAKRGLHTLLFKEVSDIGEFEEVNNIGISTDLVDDKRVFYSNIQDLKPDTEYAFQIKSEDTGGMLLIPLELKRFLRRYSYQR